MEKYLRILDILYNLLKDVFAFDELHVFLVALVPIIIVLIREYGRTKRTEIEENRKTDRTKIAEEGHTERTKMVMTGYTEQLKITKDTILGLASSMPPEEPQKQNNSNLVYFSNIVNEKAKKIL